MEEKQGQQYRLHFNLSESAKHMLDTLTARHYPGKQRRQSQLIEDLIVEAFGREQSLPVAAASDAAAVIHSAHKKAPAYQPALPIKSVAEEGELYAYSDTHPCSLCQGEMHADWKYCVYCGTGVIRRCSCCELPAVEVEGAKFCYDCGCPLS